MNLSMFNTLSRRTIAICLYTKNSTAISSVPLKIKPFHTTAARKDLMDFFDIKKNWNETNIKVGRGWRLDELRIKSNTDLHKLWYILLKERNMLYTMEHECNANVRLFPNPERIDKVEESMSNIETVVRERNTAYYKLETGETGEQPVDDVINAFGIKEKYQRKEYYLPKFMNTRWVRPYLEHGYINSVSVKKFLRLYNEKKNNEVRKANNRNFNHVQQLLKRFPNMDMEVLRAEYPNVDIEKAKRSKKARGHYLPKY